MMSSLYSVLVLSCVFTPGSTENSYLLNAAVLGRKGQTVIEDYRRVAEVLQEGHKDYCQVRFTPVEYDNSNGTTVYESLKTALDIFANPEIVIAVGPFIDVFTSMDYVIKRQIHLVTSSSEGQEKSDRALPVLPDTKSLSNAVAEIVRTLGWTKVAFLSQDDFSPVLALGNSEIFAWPILLPSKITNGGNLELRQTMTQLREAQMRQFILHSMDKEVVQHVIAAAEDHHLLHYSRSWFITYLDFPDLTLHLKETVSLYGIQLLNAEAIPARLYREEEFRNRSRLDLGLLVDVVSILRHCLRRGHSESYCDRQPLKNQTRNQKMLNEVFEDRSDTYVGALGQYIWGHTEDGQSRIRTSYSMSVLQHINNATIKDNIKIGNYTFLENPVYTTSSGGTQQKEVRDIRTSLKGMTFTVITKKDPPFYSVRNGIHEGFCIDVLDALKKLMGIDYKILPYRGKWAGLNEDKEWEDILHKLMVGDAAIAIGGLVVKSKREAQISFSNTILTSSVSMLIKRPPLQPTFFQFLWPFDIGLWFMIAIFFFIVGLSLFLMTKYDTTQRTAEQKFDLKESMWYSLNVILQGGTEFSPQTTSIAVTEFSPQTTVDCILLFVGGTSHHKPRRFAAGGTEFSPQTTLIVSSCVFFVVGGGTEFSPQTTLIVSTCVFYHVVVGGGTEFSPQTTSIVAVTEFSPQTTSIAAGTEFSPQTTFDVSSCSGTEVLTSHQAERGTERFSPNNHLNEQTGVKLSGELELENMVGVFIVLGCSVTLGVLVEICKRIYLAVQNERNNENGDKS
ncbi:glutamate receptor ionotropic, kainate 3-like [Argopecten irradians]|uniref:glutamate receptor ionotropic, kainate 3-like n=1 Tax=Argopecten irradians TaxID=31199 RepID=UPI00371BB6BA